MPSTLWQNCLNSLQDELPDKEFNMLIRPLQAEFSHDKLLLLAPNEFVCEGVTGQFSERINELLSRFSPEKEILVKVRVGSTQDYLNTESSESKSTNLSTNHPKNVFSTEQQRPFSQYTFDNFVEGKSNQLARAAAMQIAQNPGGAYNPLFIYGGVGLGKTHLMHAVGNEILANNPDALILYVHSEGFVARMVRGLKNNQMEEFKRFYRSANALLIDDIQFFAGKERSQEEFFHTFNALLDGRQQIILTCDRYPKEINGVEERLKSRFGWGLTVAIEPPELEMRVAILVNKAEQSSMHLPDEVAFFIAKRIQSNVRELEGALKRVIASAHLTGRAITLDFARDALKDLLAVQAKLVSIDNIQKTVAEYYKLQQSDLTSKNRTRFIVRARQVAMTLAKELTNHSLTEIGKSFGGRDHTTVIHACDKIQLLMAEEMTIKEDYMNLLRVLST